ncbi:hypothetical protein AOLI_G00276560 [Acnodon oligacanthus]
MSSHSGCRSNIKPCLLDLCSNEASTWPGLRRKQSSRNRRNPPVSRPATHYTSPYSPLSPARSTGQKASPAVHPGSPDESCQCPVPARLVGLTVQTGLGFADGVGLDGLCWKQDLIR